MKAAVEVVFMFLYLVEKHGINMHSDLFQRVELFFTVRDSVVGVNLEYYDLNGRLAMVHYVEVTVQHDAQYHAVELYAKALELAEQELGMQYEVMEVAAA